MRAVAVALAILGLAGPPVSHSNPLDEPWPRQLVLSDRIGECLDREENKRWDLYEDSAFVSARYYQIGEASYLAQIVREEAGQQVLHRVPISPVMFRVWGNYITNHERIEAERGEMSRRERELVLIRRHLFLGGAAFFGMLALVSAQHWH